MIETLAKKVGTQLMLGPSDSAQLVDLAATETGLSSQAAQKLIYQIVSNLNKSLFPKVTKLELMLTEGCNLSCAYCFEKKYLHKRNMSEQTAQSAIDLLFDYSGDAPDLQITHFGGEPTLNFKVLKAATIYAERRAKECGKTLEFNMTSNGVMYTDEMLEFFGEHKIKVLLSVDGLQPTHDKSRIDKRGNGTFARVMENLRRLKAVQPWIGVKMTVTADAATDLYDNVIGLREFGVNQFIIGPATGTEWSAAQINSYYQNLLRLHEWYKNNKANDLVIDDFDDTSPFNPHFGCSAARFSISVAASGEISGCSKILTLEPGKIIGQLGEITHGITNLKLRHEMINCDKLRQNCESEGIAQDYNGGCFACNFDMHKDIFKPNHQEHMFSVLLRSVLNGTPFDANMNTCVGAA